MLPPDGQRYSRLPCHGVRIPPGECSLGPVSLRVRGHGERAAVSRSYASGGAEQTHLHSALWCALRAMAELQ